MSEARASLRLLICGDRNWTDAATIRETIERIQPDVVIQGGCRGADLLAKKAAEDLGIEVEEYLADWKKFGRAAGPIRNGRMLEEGGPDLVIGFHDHIENSKGTRNMVKQAEKAGIPVRIEKSKMAE